MRPFGLVLACLALAACVTEDTLAPPVAGLPPEDACGAPALQGLVGQPLAAFEALDRKGPVRVLRPGQPATMDYSPARLNVVLDAQDRIVKVSCG